MFYIEIIIFQDTYHTSQTVSGSQPFSVYLSEIVLVNDKGILLGCAPMFWHPYTQTPFVHFPYPKPRE